MTYKLTFTAELSGLPLNIWIDAICIGNPPVEVIEHDAVRGSVNDGIPIYLSAFNEGTLKV